MGRGSGSCVYGACASSSWNGMRSDGSPLLVQWRGRMDSCYCVFCPSYVNSWGRGRNKQHVNSGVSRILLLCATPYTCQGKNDTRREGEITKGGGRQVLPPPSINDGTKITDQLL